MLLARRRRPRGRGARARDGLLGARARRPASSSRCGAALTRLAGSFVVAGSAFSGYAAAALYDDRALGIALLASALVNGVLAAVLFRRGATSPRCCGRPALALAAVGTAQLLSDATLTIAWAAEAAVLAWLAERAARAALPPRRARLARARARPLARRRRAALRALPRERASRLGRAEPARAGRGGGALTAWLRADVRARARRRLGGGRPVNVDAPRPPADAARAARRSRPCSRSRPRRSRCSSSSRAGTGATSRSPASGARSRSACCSPGSGSPGVAWAGATVALAVALRPRAASPATRAGPRSPSPRRPRSLAALLFERELGARLGDAAASTGAGLAVGAGLGVAGHDLQWLLVLAVGALYVALGAAFLRARRDQSTLLWAHRPRARRRGGGQLLEGFWLVLALSGAAAVAALLARFEERLDVAALLAARARARRRRSRRGARRATSSSAQRHPGEGVPAALAVARRRRGLRAGCARWQRTAVIWTAVGRRACSPRRSRSSSWPSRSAARSTPTSSAATRRSAPSGASSGWRSSTPASSAARPRSSSPASASSALALVKLFVYDLAFLSSVARALSFLAVGAVLIAGGFFYQRLAAGPEHGRRGREAARLERRRLVDSGA